jgi:predicted MFS family arabinose efflux permease
MRSLRSRVGRPGVVLFACMFASQAGLLVLSPILPELARDLGVSTATAGQLRTLSGATGGISAVLLALLPWRPGLRLLLTAGAALMTRAPRSAQRRPGSRCWPWRRASSARASA